MLGKATQKIKDSGAVLTNYGSHWPHVIIKMNLESVEI